MAEINFNQLLSTPLDSVTKPLPLPAGTWNGVIRTIGFDKSRNKETPYCRVNFALTSPGEDIDASELENVKWQGRELFLDYYLTADAMFRLKEFLASCGIQIEGRTFSEAVPELIGCEIIAVITQRPSEDGKDIYANVRNLKGTANQ